MNQQNMGPRVQSGLPGLDKLLEGGFPPGKVVLVLGEPGTGKSILASQYLMWGLTNGHENGVFIGMNESKERYVSEMKGLGMDFEPFEKDTKFGFVDATDIRRIPDQARVGRIPVGGRELGLVNLVDTIQEAAEKFAPKRIAIDSISDLVFRFPEVEQRRPVILDLVEALQSTGSTCVMTSEVTSTGTERTLQPEEYLAEGVIQLKTLQKGGRSIQVLKMRGSKIDTKPRPYVISEKGIEVLATEEIY
ncbi:MAG TPA: ATPase domain-containing protein [Nitrososphaerales archaeon]